MSNNPTEKTAENTITEKVKLFNNDKDIKSISVLGLFRDDSKYLDFFNEVMTAVEKRYDVEFEYYFLENNSKDDTRKKLKKFIKSRKGKLVLLNLKKDYEVNELAINYERINTLATLRNKLKDSVTPLKTDWTLMIDSGIYFQADVFERMFQVNPEKNNITMMSSYTSQVYPREQLENTPGLEHVKAQLAAINNSDVKLINVLHVYDTYSIVDLNGCLHFPFCPFEKCMLCVGRPDTFELIPKTQDIVDCFSFFCGFVLIESQTLNHKAVRWGTMCLNTAKKTAICEHILFCDRVRTLTDKRTVILQNIDNVFRTS